MKISFKKTIISLITVALLATTAIIGMKELSAFQKDKLYASQLNEITAAAQLPEDFHSKLDTLMSFINGNSRHAIDSEFYANWRDQTKMGVL